MTNLTRAVAFFALFLITISGCTPSTSAPNDGPREITPKYQANLSTVYGFGSKIDLTKNVSLASDFSWKDSAGVLHSLNSLKGKVVLLNFWAIWCPYCIDEMPALQDIQNKEAADSVVVIGVSIDNGNNPFQDDLGFVQFKNFKYQMMLDVNQDVYKNYSQQNAIPQSFLIDRQGVIQQYFNHEYAEKDYLAAIDAIK
jgi:peroxiredoxin